MSKREFVERVLKAVEIAKQKGAVLNAEACIAQAALESGWGNSVLASKHNNLFGMKAGSTWGGSTVHLWTFEYYGGRLHKVLAQWRIFPSWNECLVNYSEFIQERAWFRDALVHADHPHGDGNAYAWIEKLVNSDSKGEFKWATDPAYLDKIMGRVAVEVEQIKAGVA